MTFKAVLVIVLNLVIVDLSNTVQDSNKNLQIVRIGHDYYRVDSDTDASDHSMDSKALSSVEKASLSGKLALGDDELSSNSSETEIYKEELKLGNNAEVSGTNPHLHNSIVYPHFGRRFILQYPYSEIDKKIQKIQEENRLKPVRAPPEVVLAVAKQSAILEASKVPNPADEIINKKVLRNGNYWNAVWKEDVNPENTLRMRPPIKPLKSISARLKPGSNIYDLVSILKNVSPKLIYVINKKNFDPK